MKRIPIQIDICNMGDHKSSPLEKWGWKMDQRNGNGLPLSHTTFDSFAVHSLTKREAEHRICDVRER